MRTTVDLPPAVHRRAQELAAQTGRSLSATIADLTARGLAHVDDSVRIELSEKSGFPMIRIGRAISAAEVADLIDED